MSRSLQFTLLAVGILSGFFWFESISLPIYLIFGALLLGLFIARYGILSFGIIVTGLFLGFLYGSLFAEFRSPRDLRVGSRSFQGAVVDDPEKRGQIVRLIVRTDALADRSTRVLVTTRTQSFSYGDRVLVEGVVELPEPLEDFDYPGYLKSRGIFAIARQAVVTKQGRGGYLIPRVLFSLRHTVEDAVNRLFREPEASLLAGLLLGIRRTMGDAFAVAMTASGTTHLVAVSGFNLTIVAEAFRRLLSGFNRKMAFFAMTIGVILFTLLVGAPASAARAAVMVWLVNLGRIIGRKPYIPALLSFVALVMSLPNPYLPRHDVSFQLSFLAILGLTVITPLIAQKLERIPFFVREPLATTLGAQAATLPLIISTFGAVSVVAPLANVLVLSAIPLAMFLGGVAAAGGALLEGLGQILALPAQVILSYISSVIIFFGGLPGALRPLSVSALLGLATAALLVGIFVRAIRKHHG